MTLDWQPSKSGKEIMVPFLVLFPVLTAMVFMLVERRTRTLWQRWAMVGPRSPYRSMAQGGLVAGRAPASVRASALTSVLLGSAVVPGVVYAMVKIRYDGIAPLALYRKSLRPVSRGAPVGCSSRELASRPICAAFR